ncbi:MAG: hypothetical protein JNJ98_10540 [Gemmatimonadetes bacterium]|nr:hypothetical protein [Gemmatimonadota bacterium]
MAHSRRDFVQQLALGSMGVAGLGHTIPADLFPAQAGPWDTSWAARIKGKHKACFDCTEPESGYGVWRANAWFGQYMDVLKVSASDLSPVIILRHNAIVLTLQHAFIKKYALGKKFGVTHPLTGAAIEQNPALLDEKDGIPAPFNNGALPKQIARGVIALACNLALQDVVDVVAAADKVNDAEARKRSLAAMLPGVILQPSGVFAAVRAQEAGCAYVKAS